MQQDTATVFNDNTVQLSLSYKVQSTNSIVLIVGSCGWYKCAFQNSITGCTTILNNTDTFGNVFASVCDNQATGSYNVKTISIHYSGMSMVAYVFPTNEFMFQTLHLTVQ